MADNLVYEPNPDDVPRVLPVPGLLLDQSTVNANTEQQLDHQAQAEMVSSIHKCQTHKARYLCIYDIYFKLNHENTYNIGGTFNLGTPDLWFYYSTSLCPVSGYMLNLFVLPTHVGVFSIGICDFQDGLFKEPNAEHLTLSGSLAWSTYRNINSEESFYIKSFNITKNHLKSLERKILCIPIQIKLGSDEILNAEEVRQIKLRHDLGHLLKLNEKTDFILESASRKQFPSHKIILAAHSPVLREIIKNSKSNTAFIDITDHAMELLLEFIYTGTFKDVYVQDYIQLLEIAERFDLKNLFLLTQYAINGRIDENNAIEIAVLAEKHSLDWLQTKVFHFIRKHPKILETESWKNLNDINVAKKLCENFQKELVN